MGDFADRLRAIREDAYGERGKSAFARAVGIPITSYENYEQGRLPTMDIVVKMMAATRVNPRWLFHGKGPQYLNKDTDLPPAEDAVSLIADLLQEKQRLKEDLKRAGQGQKPAVQVIPVGMNPRKWLAERGRIEIEAEKHVAVPILRPEILVRRPRNVLDLESEGWLLCPRSAIKHPKTTAAFEVEDNGMLPTIPKGSLAVVDYFIQDPHRIYKGRNRLVAVRTKDGSCVVRLLEKAEKHWLAVPTTPSQKNQPTAWLQEGKAGCPTVGKVVLTLAFC